MSSAEGTTESVEARAAGRGPTRIGKTPRRRTQAERSEEMQLRLVNAAAQVLRRKGYAGLRTEEVSRVARVSRGAQQHHFPTKDSLIVATAAHLLRQSLTRGRERAERARGDADPIEAIIQDCVEFFLGPDFGVILDLVLAGTKDKRLRDVVYSRARESRVEVESAWVEVLVEHGLPREKAFKILWLTISIVRGFAVRALWQRDEKLFRELLDEWKLILSGHVRTITGKSS